MITDGFDEAKNIGGLSGTELVETCTLSGVTLNVYMQECKGLSADGQPGWYHVGVDLLDADTGETIDNFPVDLNASTEQPGHYHKLEGLETARTVINEWVKAHEAFNAEPSESTWKQGFINVAKMRRQVQSAQQFLQDLLELIDEDEDDDFSSFSLN